MPWAKLTRLIFFARIVLLKPGKKPEILKFYPDGLHKTSKPGKGTAI